MSSPSSPVARHAVPAVGRCSNCGSRLRPDEVWCSLCHTSVAGLPAQGGTDLEPGTDVVPGTEVESSTDVEPGTEVASAVVGERAEKELDPAVAAVADKMLAELEVAEADRARESGLESFRRRFGGLEGNQGAIILAVGGGVFLLALSMVGLTLLGLLL